MYAPKKTSMAIDEVNEDEQINHLDKYNKADGTMRYMSPEQITGIQSNKIDIWAFGCILLYFVTGMDPYFGVKETEIVDLL